MSDPIPRFKQNEYLCSAEYLKKQIALRLSEKFAYKKNEKNSKRKLRQSVAYDREIQHLIEKQINQLSEKSFRPCEDDPKKPFLNIKNESRLVIKKKMRHRRTR